MTKLDKAWKKLQEIPKVDKEFCEGKITVKELLERRSKILFESQQLRYSES